MLQWGGRVAEIPLSIADLEAQFTPYPSSEITWGSSIMQVEDAISPYRDALVDYHVLELHNAASLRTLSDEIGQISMSLSSVPVLYWQVIALAVICLNFHTTLQLPHLFCFCVNGDIIWILI